MVARITRGSVEAGVQSARIFGKEMWAGVKPKGSIQMWNQGNKARRTAGEQNRKLLLVTNERLGIKMTDKFVSVNTAPSIMP